MKRWVDADFMQASVEGGTGQKGKPAHGGGTTCGPAFRDIADGLYGLGLAG